ncbi:MAG: pitrilysin family protein [Phycisphaerae bacterium]
MSEQYFTQLLPNGMMLLGQKMGQVSSAAMSLVVPAGASHDPAGAEGAASISSEWCLRGAGGRDTRGLNDALDSLGCQHQESVLSEHIQFSAAQLGSNMAAVMDLYADIVLRPRLEETTFEPCKALAIQDLASLEDEPIHKCNLMLRERYYPYPLGRSIYGTEESLNAVTAAAVRQSVQAGFTPDGAILAVAGNIDWDKLCAQVQKLFGSWRGATRRIIKPTAPLGGVVHIHKDSAQTHIALAHRSVTISDPRYYAARMAEVVLSGGMSSRLFTEVREKRGLVYHVSTRYHSLKDHAGMFTYAATMPEKGQQTLEVTVGEIRRLAEGVSDEEMARARTQLKSSLVMQGESTSSRANAMTADWYHLGRLRTLAELSEQIDKVTVDEVIAYLCECPARNFTVLVIGPQPLDTRGLN